MTERRHEDRLNNFSNYLHLADAAGGRACVPPCGKARGSPEGVGARQREQEQGGRPMREGVDLWTLSQSLLQSLLEPEIRSRLCVLEGSQGSVLSEWSDHRPGHPREGRPLLGTDSPHTHPCHSPSSCCCLHRPGRQETDRTGM